MLICPCNFLFAGKLCRNLVFDCVVRHLAKSPSRPYLSFFRFSHTSAKVRGDERGERGRKIKEGLRISCHGAYVSGGDVTSMRLSCSSAIADGWCCRRRSGILNGVGVGYIGRGETQLWPCDRRGCRSSDVLCLDFPRRIEGMCCRLLLVLSVRLYIEVYRGRVAEALVRN